jgi:catechol 2,3-dioxygenase-like lactoylglutathione lyase family enzyme
MGITLDHTVIAAEDNLVSARRFADIMGVAIDGHEGVDGKFVSVRVNETLRLFFFTVQPVTSLHLAFVVDDATFDAVVKRLRQAGMRFGSSPRDPTNGRTDHPLAPRGLFWVDPDGHLFELMTSG